MKWTVRTAFRHQLTDKNIFALSACDNFDFWRTKIHF